MPACCGAVRLPGGIGMTAVPAPQVLRITVPGVPPSVNHQYVRRPTGGLALTREAREYRQTAREYAAVAARQQRWTLVPVGEQVLVRLWYYWPDRWRRDAQKNKLLFDAREGVIYEDDKDVLPQVMAAEVDRENPRVEIEVRKPLEDD